jgi:hypothetical protein
MARAMVRTAQGHEVIRVVGSALFARLHMMEVNETHVAATWHLAAVPVSA